MKRLKISVIGDGSWATALVKVLANNAEKIHWHIHDKEAIDHLKKYRKNPNFLSSLELDMDKTYMFDNVEETINDSETVWLAVPSVYLKAILENADPEIFNNRKVISAIKGIIPEENLLISEYLENNFQVFPDAYAVISGPSHAEEVAKERLTFLTAASQNSLLAEEVSGLMECRYIKTTVSNDYKGIEYAAVLKNIMAIAVGIYLSLGFGDNFLAVLASNAIREISRFVNAAVPLQRNTDDFAYLGDLLVTSYSQFSRNRTFGTMIGKGYSVKSVQLEMNMVAEGYHCTKSIVEINQKLNLDMPVTSAVYDVLFNDKDVTETMHRLAENLK